MSSFQTWTRNGAGEAGLQEWELTGGTREYEGGYGFSGAGAAPRDTEYESDYEAEDEGEYEGEFEEEGEYEEEFEYEGAQLEQELTYELMAVTNEAELDQFIGKLIKSVGKFAKSGVGRAIGGVIKGVAKAALPLAGAAVGSVIAPGAGTALGGQLGSMAGSLLEPGEAELLGEEEAEFEASRRFVKWGLDAAELATKAPPNVPARTAARAAAVTAARRHAPRLLKSKPKSKSKPRPTSWRDRRPSRTPASGRRADRSQFARRPVRRRPPGPPWQWVGVNPWAIGAPPVDPGALEPADDDWAAVGAADDTLADQQDDADDSGGFEF